MRFQEFNYQVLGANSISVDLRPIEAIANTTSKDDVMKHFRLIFDEDKEELLWGSGTHDLVTSASITDGVATIEFDANAMNSEIAGWTLNSSSWLTIALDFAEAPKDIVDAIVEAVNIGNDEMEANVEAILEDTSVTIPALIADVDADVAAVQTTVNAVQGDVSTVLTELDNVDASIATLNTSIENLDASVAAVKTDTETIITTLGEMESADASLSADVAEILVDTSETIPGLIADVSALVVDLDTDVVAVKEVVDGLVTDIADVSADIVTLSSDVSAVKTDTETIIATLGEMESADASLSADVAAILEDTSVAIPGLIADVSALVVDLDTDVVAVKSDTSSIIATLAEMENADASIAADLAEILEDTSVTLPAAIEGVSNQVTELDASVAAVKTAVDEAKTAIVADTEDIQAKIGAAEDSSVVETVFGKLNALIETLGTRLDTIEAELSEVKQLAMAGL